jgi:hypothetical protein
MALGDEAAPGTRLALEDDRGVGGRHPLEQGEERTHAQRLPEHRAEAVALARRDGHGDVAGEELQGAATEAHLGAHGEDAVLHLGRADVGAAVAAEIAHPDAAGHQGDLQVVLAYLRIAQDEVVVGVGAHEQRARLEQGLPPPVGPARHPHAS